MIVCIVGPTGVGKTKLSEILAEKLDAIIINADAMQVYKELNIGTAKIKKEELCEKKHFLFDIKDVSDDYTVYDYQKDARKIIDDTNGNIIMVGGTGLYLKAALYNYEFSDITEKNNYDEYTNEELYKMLEEKNMAFDVHINNRKRMISKLNSTPHNNGKNVPLYDDIVFIGLTTDRERLYSIIDNRVDKMIEEGLLDEAKNLYSKYGKVKSLMTGIGYKELIDYFDNKISLEVAIELIKSRSRHYAKRQYTWFNNQMDVKWFDVDFENFDNTVDSVLKYLEI